MVAQAELVAQGDELVVAVAGAHEGERDVVAAQLVDDVVGRAASRGRRRPAGPSPRCRRRGGGGRGAAPGPARPRRSLSGSGPVRTTVTSPAGLPPRVHGDRRRTSSFVEMTWSAVRKVARSRASRPAVRQPGAVGEPRLVELGAQVVVVEDEPRAVATAQPARDRPEDVGRVARLDRRRTARCRRACSTSQRGGQERVGVLDDEPGGPASGRVRPVLVAGSTPSRTARRGSPLPFGQTTVTSYPAAVRAWHSSQTRRSKGTGRFCTMMSTRGRAAAGRRGRGHAHAVQPRPS